MVAQQARATGKWACGLFLYNQQSDVSFSCVCPVIDHEFRHNIVKVAVDLQTYFGLPLSTETSDSLKHACLHRFVYTRALSYFYQHINSVCIVVAFQSLMVVRLRLLPASLD